MVGSRRGEFALTWRQVMLVDLARNDINRVCDPLTTRVDKLMVVQKVCAVPLTDEGC